MKRSILFMLVTLRTTSIIFSQCVPSTKMDTLDINEVQAFVLNGGDLHRNAGNPGYEVPKGSGKHSIFASALWMGGIDAGGQLKGLILDLRNNPGGYLDTAVSTISDWIDSGKVAVKEIGLGNSEKDYKTEGVPRLKGTKTIILVNEGSASASEILAGALQDYKVATLVGHKTFGKGSVQELEDLKDNSEIKVTVAKWYTPSGRGINKTGLEPDIKVDLSADDIKNQKDPQMDKALELLK